MNARLLLSLALLSFGCGGADDQDFSIPDQEVEGQVSGMSWTPVAAYAEADPFTSGELRVELHADAAFEPCGASAPDGSSVFFSVPAQPGRYELSLRFSSDDRTATFYDGMGSNVIASRGVIEIDDVGDGEVAGGLNIDAGDGNTLAGLFVAQRCPAEE